MEAIRQIENKNYEFLDEILYSELFNDKTMAVYENPDFKRHITEYIDNLENLLRNSSLLNTHFTGSAEELSKSFTNHNLFEAQHKIFLEMGGKLIILPSGRNLYNKSLTNYTKRLH